MGYGANFFNNLINVSISVNLLFFSRKFVLASNSLDERMAHSLKRCDVRVKNLHLDRCVRKLPKKRKHADEVNKNVVKAVKKADTADVKKNPVVDVKKEDPVDVKKEDLEDAPRDVLVTANPWHQVEDIKPSKEVASVTEDCLVRESEHVGQIIVHSVIRYSVVKFHFR